MSIFEDYGILLDDRIKVIRETDRKFDLEKNAYLSFSGGKDSTILHYLIDMALPGNRIPRVFLDTGIEYLEIRKFVKGLSEKDDRFVIVRPTKPIKAVLDKYGYPFKSKEFSHHLGIYQRSGKTKSVRRFLQEDDGAQIKMFTCPIILRHMFTANGSPEFKVSSDCCKKLKKETAHRYETESQRRIAITGMRREEGGQRMRIKGCILTDGEGKLKRFHPLIVVSEEWENRFLKENGIELCKLYYPPFNFKRTGCKGCPFAVDLQEQLAIMEVYMPNERAQCELIWKPVYEEYRKLGYRLDREEQLKIL